jgi:tetratricopeptide (TPR) repeat protein
MLASSSDLAQSLADTRALLARAATDRNVALALARCTHLAADVQKDDARVVSLTQEGMTALAQASPSADDAEMAYLHALNLGLFVRAKGMMAVGRLSELVAQLKVAGTTPALDEGGPLRVLGLLYVKAPGWPMGPGDLDAALDLLRQAARDFPNHPLNHLYLAYALVDAGERQQAAEEIRRTENLCTPERFGEWAGHWRQEAEQLSERTRH